MRVSRHWLGLAAGVLVASVASQPLPAVAAHQAGSAQRGAATTSSQESPQDGRWIAFADKVGVHLIRPNGADNHMLVNRWGARYPAWSPNGHWLAYTQLGHWSTRSKKTTINVVRPNGTGHRVVTKGFEPTWTNHGKSLIYVNDADKPPFLREINLRSGKIRVLRVPRLDDYRSLDEQSPGESAMALNVYTVSPDGSTIAWMVTQGTGEQISSERWNGSHFQTRRVRHVWWDYPSPGWMSHGYTFSCIGRRAFSPDLCEVNMTTGKIIDLSKRYGSTYQEEYGILSPSGHHLMVGAANALYVASANGSHPHTLFGVSTKSGNPTDPVWQPAP